MLLAFLLLVLKLKYIHSKGFNPKCLCDTHAPAEKVLRSLMYGAFKQTNDQTKRLATSNK